MKIIEIEQTNKTPYVLFTDSSLTLIGRTYPENAVGFYKPIMNELNEIEKYDEFTVDLNLEYINTSSSKAILYLIRKIADKCKGEVNINWSIEKGDDSMDDMAELFNSMINNIKITKIIVNNY